MALPKEKVPEVAADSEDYDVYYSKINEDESIETSSLSSFSSPPKFPPPPLPARLPPTEPPYDPTEEYDIPAEVEHPTLIHKISSPIPSTPPILPPKGQPSKVSEDNESEYKVPNVIPKIPEESYQVPPSNTTVIPSYSFVKEMDTLMSTSFNLSSNKPSLSPPEKSKPILCKPEIKQKNITSVNDESSKPKIELGKSGWSAGESVTSGGSIKDRIAKLNQINEPKEKEDSKFNKSKEISETKAPLIPHPTLKPKPILKPQADLYMNDPGRHLTLLRSEIEEPTVLKTEENKRSSTDSIEEGNKKLFILSIIFKLFFFNR